MSEEVVYKTMLFDYYSEFLTEKQKQYFDMHFNDDLSLAEISEQNGVSKQAVWDNIRHAEATLTNAENKLGLVKKSVEMKKLLDLASADIRKISTKSADDSNLKCQALDLIAKAQDLY